MYEQSQSQQLPKAKVLAPNSLASGAFTNEVLVPQTPMCEVETPSPSTPAPLFAKPAVPPTEETQPDSVAGVSATPTLTPPKQGRKRKRELELPECFKNVFNNFYITTEEGTHIGKVLERRTRGGVREVFVQFYNVENKEVVLTAKKEWVPAEAVGTAPVAVFTQDQRNDVFFLLCETRA